MTAIFILNSVFYFYSDQTIRNTMIITRHSPPNRCELLVRPIDPIQPMSAQNYLPTLWSERLVLQALQLLESY